MVGDVAGYYAVGVRRIGLNAYPRLRHMVIGYNMAPVERTDYEHRTLVGYNVKLFVKAYMVGFKGHYVTILSHTSSVRYICGESVPFASVVFGRAFV